MRNIDLYNESDSISYSNGSEDCSSGVGLPEVSPLLSTWNQVLSPPNGWGIISTMGIVDAWCYGGYFYALVNDGTGPGIGIYRYELDTASSPVSMSYDSYALLSNLGLNGIRFIEGSGVVFDSSDNSVLLCTYGTTGTVTPVCGKWLMSSWPFSSANAEWKT